jgi:hypothetical protein
MMEELVPSFPLVHHHMSKKHKAKRGLTSKGWDQTRARMKRKEEATPGVIKLSIQEKKGAKHLFTHPHDFFLG